MPQGRWSLSSKNLTPWVGPAPPFTATRHFFSPHRLTAFSRVLQPSMYAFLHKAGKIILSKKVGEMFSWRMEVAVEGWLDSRRPFWETLRERGVTSRLSSVVHAVATGHAE